MVIKNITERFKDIMRNDSPFDVKLNKPHTENVRKYSIANKSENPKIVYIYAENEMVKGSPFASYSAAHKALGLKSSLRLCPTDQQAVSPFGGLQEASYASSNTCNRYIVTNRLYKNKYIFASKPIDRTSRD